MPIHNYEALNITLTLTVTLILILNSQLVTGDKLTVRQAY